MTDDAFDEIEVDPDNPDFISEQRKIIASALRRADAANLNQLLSDPRHEHAAEELFGALQALKLKYWQPTNRGC